MCERKLNMDYGLVQGCYWLLAAVFVVFMTPILQERGFHHAQIGVLLGIRSVAAIFSQSLVSNLADRYAEQIPLKMLTAMAALVAAISNIVFLVIPMCFMFTAVLFFVIGSATYCLSPLIDAVAMEFMKQGRALNYTVCRSVGSITWACACVGLGWMMVKFGADYLLGFQIVFLLLLGILLLRMETAGRQASCDNGQTDENRQMPCDNGQADENRQMPCDSRPADGAPHSILSLLRNNRSYTGFLIAYTLFYMSSTMCTNFQMDVITRLGGNSTSLGYAECILAISEVPVVFFYAGWKRKIGLEKMLVMIFCFGTLKVFCQSFAPNLFCFMLAQILQMFGWGMSYTAVVQFVMEAVPTADLAKGQGLLTVAGAGIGSSLASYISGILYDSFSLDVLSGVGTMIGILSVLLLTAALKIPRADGVSVYQMKEKEIKL